MTTFFIDGGEVEHTPQTSAYSPLYKMFVKGFYVFCVLQLVHIYAIIIFFTQNASIKKHHFISSGVS